MSAVFEKMGYDPAAGSKVFSILLDLLAKDKARLIEEEMEEQEEAAAAEAGEQIYLCISFLVGAYWSENIFARFHSFFVLRCL